MEKTELVKTIKALTEKAEEKLEAASILLENDLFDDSISRSYYAGYYMGKALLLLLDSSPKTHSGMISMLGLKAINEGILDKQIGKDLNHLLEARQTSDYAIVTFYEEEDATEYLKIAKRVVKGIKELLRNKLNANL